MTIPPIMLNYIEKKNTIVKINVRFESSSIWTWTYEIGKYYDFGQLLDDLKYLWRVHRDYNLYIER